nr:beta-adaptin-like protein C [Ipomoea trifida]
MSKLSPTNTCVLPASTGEGLQISVQLTRRDVQIFYSMLFENNSQIPLDGFMIQFNKNTFGVAARGICKYSVAHGFVPSTLLQVAVKNNQQPVWYFNDKISEDDKMIMRSTFLENANRDMLCCIFPRGISFLIELTATIGSPALKSAIKTPNPEMAPLFFQSFSSTQELIMCLSSPHPFLYHLFGFSSSEWVLNFPFV